MALDSFETLFADQPVSHAGRRATFLHMSGGVAIIRYCGGSHAVAVPPETLSLRPSRTSRHSPLAASDEPTTRESAETGQPGV